MLQSGEFSQIMLWKLVLARYFFDRMALDEDGVKQAAALGYLRHCAPTLKDYIFSNLDIISRMHNYTAAQRHPPQRCESAFHARYRIVITTKCQKNAPYEMGLPTCHQRRRSFEIRIPPWTCPRSVLALAASYIFSAVPTPSRSAGMVKPSA